MDPRAIRGGPRWRKAERRPHVAPIILPIVIDLHLAERVERVGGSFVHERVPPVGKARVERRKHRAPVLIRRVVGKIRVRQ